MIYLSTQIIFVVRIDIEGKWITCRWWADVVNCRYFVVVVVVLFLLDAAIKQDT